MSDVMSSGAQALRDFIAGGKGNAAEVREGAREVVDENRRLRAILAAMSQADLGDGALVEFATTDAGQFSVVVCCGSRSEVDLGRVVAETMREVFAERGAKIDFEAPTLRGVDAMGSESADR